MTKSRSTSRRWGYAPRWAPIALAAALAAAPAVAANRYWTFIGGCASADWVLVSAGPNSQGQLTCWSATPGGLSGQPAPGSGDDAFIINSLATAPLLVTFAAPGRTAFNGTARDLTMFGSPSFEAGLSLDRYTLSVRNMNLGLTSSAVLGRMDQSGGAVTVANDLTVLGGSYNLSGGLLNAGAVNLISQLAPAKFTHSGGTLIAPGISVGSTGGPAASFSQLAGVVNNGELAIGVGTAISGSGSVSISGGSTRWTTTGDTTVGVVSKGVLDIAGGAQFTGGAATLGLAPGSDGRVTVSGTGSQWNLGGLLTVGLGGAGRLDVTQGGKLSAGSLVLNSPPVPAGTEPAVAARFAGAGTTVTLGNALVLGRVRGSTLEVSDGATLQNALATVGETAGTESLVKLAGAGTDWNSTSGLVVGDAGKGTVQLAAGASLRSAVATLGQNAGSSGRVSLDGPAARWQNAGSLTVGDAGQGVLILTQTTGPGARVDVQGVVAGLQASGRGEIDLISGTLQNTGELRVADAGQASVLVAQGALLGTDSLTLGYGAGSAGRLAVAAPSTRLDVGQQMVIGLEGRGSFEVGSRSAVTSAYAVLGAKFGSLGQTLVDAAGTFWRNGNGLVVGQYGTGELTISNAGLVTSGKTELGQGSTGVGTVTLITGGTLQVGGNLDIGVDGRGQLNIGAQSLVQVTGLTSAAAGSQIMLDGGTLRSDRAALGDPALLDWRAGRLHITGTGGSTLDGRSLPTLVDLLPARALQVDQTLALGPNSKLLLSGGELRVGRLQLDNALLASTGGGANALDMNRIGLLIGQGAVSAPISGGAGAANRIQATGPLTLGLSGRSDGFEFGGLMTSNGQPLVLLDSNLAVLGATTQLLDSARLATINGALLGVGRQLASTGEASVQGRFVNNGVVAVNSGRLSFVDDVSGAGLFQGNVRFLAGYSPGNSTAQVRFGNGAVAFGTQSLLTMEINNDGLDQLLDIGSLSFDGTLALVFGNGYSAAPGTRLSLLDFDAFQGRLDAAHVRVSGYDIGGLDLSRLPIDGTITITAVPEPSAWAMWLAGLGVFAMRLTRPRRGHRQP